jgi:hypothetical protein
VSDLGIAELLLAFLLGLAIVAPIWGVDSRDGIGRESTYWPE